MIELKLTVSDVDYEALIRQFGGQLGGTFAAAARMLPESAKEELAVKYLNASAGSLAEKFENIAAGRGVRVKIREAKAAVIK